MALKEVNRFQDFFKEDKYVFLKNYLYSYLLRKRAVEKSLRQEVKELVLEVGSGISPVMTHANRIIYSDLSFTALQILKKNHANGWHVVADGMNLPFKPGVFSHTICSEVLEHLKDDYKALKELSRVMRPGGCLVVTFPHRKIYFANDDRFVNHLRRYEIYEMEKQLHAAGLMPVYTRKVMGPLDKMAMRFVVFCFALLQQLKPNKVMETQKKYVPINFFAMLFKWANRFFLGLVWLDARVIPRAFATVLLIKAQKKQ